MENAASANGYAFSVTNDLIQNLKKPMDRKGRPEWRHKEHAIRTFGQNLREAINGDFLRQATLVPVPPSKRVDDHEYDDRMLQILQVMAAGDPLDIREIVTMRTNLDPAHLHNNRRSVDALVPFGVRERLEFAEEEAVLVHLHCGCFRELAHENLDGGIDPDTSRSHWGIRNWLWCWGGDGALPVPCPIPRLRNSPRWFPLPLPCALPVRHLVERAACDYWAIATALALLALIVLRRAELVRMASFTTTLMTTVQGKHNQ